jgi:acetate kinase
MEVSKQGNSILIFNCGSSSLTFKVFSCNDGEKAIQVLTGKAHRVGVTGTKPSSLETHFEGKADQKIIPVKNHAQAAAAALEEIKSHNIPIHYVGHRFVHGGKDFQKSVFLSQENIKRLKNCLSLAPLHNPSSLSVITECSRSLPGARQFVTFDTAFHSSLPPVAYTYGLPKRISEKFGFRKYGFHGLSYSYVVQETARFLKVPLEDLKIVTCHLGTGGSSVAAIKHGHSIDTSMGYTPLPGLVMSTRCGDIDPMLALYLMAVYDFRPEELNDILNRKSGFLGISSFSSDIRDLINPAEENKREQAELALRMYIHRLRKYIGSYVVALGGIEVLAFTDDIGVRSWEVREQTCKSMSWCGVKLDDKANRKASSDKISVLSEKNAKVIILTIPTEEEFAICREGMKLIGENHDAFV